MKYNLRADERATLELRGLYEKYGYRKYKISKFEEYSLYAVNSDFLLSDKVLTFTDLDGRLLAMKPDVTLSVINNTSATREKPEKLYYIENVYRENKESHCFKEINQMGLEYIGNINEYSVLETVILAIDSLKTIDEDYLLEISNMQYTVHLLEELGLSRPLFVKLLNKIRQKNVTGIKAVCSQAKLSDDMAELLCQIPFLYGKMDETIARAKDMALNDKMLADLKVLEGYCNSLEKLGHSDKVQLDLSMVKDIDYYNGIVFRGYIRSLPGCILEGGQYDKAMELLGKDAGAIGFAIYLDELTKGKTEPSKYDVDSLLIYSESDDMTQVMEQAQKLMSSDRSVRVESSEPVGLRYRAKYIMADGKAKEVK